MAILRLASVNAFNLYGSREPADRERFGRVEDLIAGLDADVVAVQELVMRGAAPGNHPMAVLAELVRTLAKQVGRRAGRVYRCEIPGGDIACALGGGIHHTALLWRDGVEPVEGTLGRFGRDPAGMWHSLVTAVFEAEGESTRFRVGSTQFSPFDPGIGWGWADAGQVMRAMSAGGVPGWVGGDWNGLGSDEHYDPDPYVPLDPYTQGENQLVWHPDFAYQYGPAEAVDRSAAVRLERIGRFRDAARILDAPWTPTTGHHPADRHPPRRIDRWYATHNVPAAAVRALEVAPAEVVGEDTDHLPVVLTVDTAALDGASA